MERQVRMVAFYATNENVGKSTLSIAMANELAHLGKKGALCRSGSSKTKLRGWNRS